jgi:hypothetical protein
MDFTALQTLLASLLSLQQEVADAKALVDQAYQKGFADGAASVSVPPSDKLYSEEELQAKIKEALFPLEEKITSLEAEISLLPQKIEEGVAAFKAELLAKYNELQVAETAAEVGFGELLK